MNNTRYIVSAEGLIDDDETSSDSTWSSYKIDELLGDKVDVVEGKGLSSNDYTDADKAKLDGLVVNNAVLNIQRNGTTVKTFTANASTDVTANILVPTKTSELTNDSGYITTNNRKSFYGTCETAADVSDKVITLADTDGWELKAGTVVGIKFTYSNSASNVTFNINSTGAKSIWYNNSAYSSNSSDICGSAGRVNYYMYDGSTYWVWINMGVLDGNTNTVPSAQCETSAASAAKVAICTNYSLTADSYLLVNMRYANTSASAITLEVNGKGAVPIYIDGAASSASNYTLPAGTYITFYDGTNFYFRTDGKLTGVGMIDVAGSTDTFLRSDGTWQSVSSSNDKVTQTADNSTNSDFEVIFSNTADNTTRTETARKSSKLKFNPSSGELAVEGYRRIDITGHTLDLDTLSISAGAPNIQYYICKTSNGSESITNRPVLSQHPFILDVEVIRSNSISDYITQQTYRNYDNKANEYVRWCVNGTWSEWTTRVFTDTNNAVTQTVTTTSANYEVLFSGTSDNTTHTEGARKNSNLKFNPSTGNLQTTQINGVTVGSDPKFTDTTYENKSASPGGADESLVTTGDKYTWNNKSDFSGDYSDLNGKPTLGTAAAKNSTDTYSSTGTDVTTGKAVASAIGTLDVTGEASIAASKTIASWSETDGKVSITTQNISITKSQVSDFPTLGSAASRNVTSSVTSGSSDVVTSGAVYAAIDGLPEPMVFKGSLGTGGTITALPVDGTATIGDTYKVITAGTYAGKAAKIGDTFICLTKTSSANTWELIPSGDEPSGTVTSVATGVGLTGGTITTSGTIKAKLRSETALTNDSAAATETANRIYPVVPDKSGYLAVNVPWTDNNTDTKVTQTADDSTNSDFEVIFSNTADNTTRTEATKKSSKLKFNPSTGNLQATQLNGVTIGSSPKFTDNDTKNTAGSTDTSSKIFLVGATSQAANPQTYSDDQVYVTSGTLQANVVNASAGINANTANSGAAGGVSLYSNNPAGYGITMRNTGTSTGQLGKHGYVQGDWAGYLCFSGATNRGYIFRQAGSNVASVSGEGHAVFNGSVTIGGNAANTSGARMQYNSTNQCIDFIFV